MAAPAEPSSLLPMSNPPRNAADEDGANCGASKGAAVPETESVANCVTAHARAAAASRCVIESSAAAAMAAETCPRPDGVASCGRRPDVSSRRE